MSIKIGGTNTGRIAPDGDGVVNAISWSASGGYDISPAADGMSAVFTATTAGTGYTATVSAMNSLGVTLTDTKPLDDVEAGAATALNLTISNP